MAMMYTIFRKMEKKGEEKNCGTRRWFYFSRISIEFYHLESNLRQIRENVKKSCLDSTYLSC